MPSSLTLVSGMQATNKYRKAKSLGELTCKTHSTCPSRHNILHMSHPHYKLKYISHVKLLNLSSNSWFYAYGKKLVHEWL